MKMFRRLSKWMLPALWTASRPPWIDTRIANSFYNNIISGKHIKGSRDSGSLIFWGGIIMLNPIIDTKYGKLHIRIPRDREGEFKQQLIPKYERRRYTPGQSGQVNTYTYRNYSNKFTQNYWQSRSATHIMYSSPIYFAIDPQNVGSTPKTN